MDDTTMMPTIHHICPVERFKQNLCETKIKINQIHKRNIEIESIKLCNEFEFKTKGRESKSKGFNILLI